ncbi:cytochrome p450 [Hirsutella rhossiliensis]
MATAADIISAYIFGIEHGTNLVSQERCRKTWINLCRSMNERFFWIQELPNLNSFCSKFGIRLYPLLADKAQSEIRSWNKKLCEKAYTTIPSSSHEFCQPANESVLFNAFRTGLQREATKEGSALYGLPLSGQKSILACEVLDTILGGHESMAFAFTHLVWRLTQFPKVQDQLREELLAMKVGDKCDNTLGTAKALDSLPILHSVVMETLRVDAPNPGPQLRETAYPSCKIGKYEIPGGVHVAASAYVLHRDESVFPNADHWDHTRWLSHVTDDDHLRRMNQQFWAFGNGGRIREHIHQVQNFS